ncbi:hypothetical protein T492DRAFT_899560, partial [Pavlovales sp. CCMP2436]
TKRTRARGGGAQRGLATRGCCDLAWSAHGQRWCDRSGREQEQVRGARAEAVQPGCRGVLHRQHALLLHLIQRAGVVAA